MKSDKNKAIMAKKRNGAGRPRINIDVNILSSLAQIGCTQEEMASVVGISARTLQRNYAEIVDRNREKGKASLKLPTDKIAEISDLGNSIYNLSVNYPIVYGFSAIFIALFAGVAVSYIRRQISKRINTPKAI